MEVYVEIDFPLSIGRYGMKGSTISNQQYLPYILSIGNLSLNIGDDHSFEVSNVPILFDDIDGHFRDRFASDIDKNIQGSLVKLYQSGGTKIATLKIWDYQFLDKKFQINCTNKIGELWNDFTEKITFEEFPNTSSANSVGQVIPDCYGEMATTSGGMIKGWQVEANKYLVNATVIGGSTLDAAYLEDGTDITGGCVLSTTADGLRTTVTYSATNPHAIICDITIGGYSGNDVQDVLEANLNKWVGFNSGNYTPKAGLNTFLDGANYNSHFLGYANYSAKTGEELLKHFCYSYNVDWITNSDNEVEIKWVDINNLTADYTIQDNKAKEFPYSSSTDPEDYANKILSQGNYYYNAGAYNKQFEFNEFESQSVYGIRPINIEAKFLKTDEDIVWTAKYYAMFNKNPRQRAYTQMNIDDWFGNSLEVGDLIDFKHPNDRLKGSADILYQIRKVNINFTSNIVDLELWDIDYLKNIDTDINLLIQSNAGNDYLDFFDMSMRMDGDGNHVLNPALSISNQNTQVLFQRSSIYAWGSRRMTTPNATEWDIVNSLANNATISIYLYVHDLSSTYTDAQNIVSHIQDNNNKWAFRLQTAGVGAGSNGKPQFFVSSGGVVDFTMVSNSALSTGQWYHVAFCKSGSDMGLYIDGTQTAYTSLGTARNFNGLLYLFGDTVSSTTPFLQAYVSEFFLTNNNFYSATPVVGLADTITPFYQPLTQQADNKTLQVYNPRLSDTWTIGNTYRIKWNVPGLNVTIELWDSAGSGGAWVADIATVQNKQYYDWDTTGAAANNRTIKVYDTDGNISDWSDVFTLA